MATTIDELIKLAEESIKENIHRFYLSKLRELKSSQSATGMKWVKASERLPEDGLEVCIRVRNKKTGIYLKYIACYGEKIKCFWLHKPNNLSKKVPIEIVEWLDESAPNNLSQAISDIKAWAMKKDGCIVPEELCRRLDNILK